MINISARIKQCIPINFIKQSVEFEITCFLYTHTLRLNEVFIGNGTVMSASHA